MIQNQGCYSKHVINLTFFPIKNPIKVHITEIAALQASSHMSMRKLWKRATLSCLNLGTYTIYPTNWTVMHGNSCSRKINHPWLLTLFITKNISKFKRKIIVIHHLVYGLYQHWMVLMFHFQNLFSTNSWQHTLVSILLKSNLFHTNIFI